MEYTSNGITIKINHRDFKIDDIQEYTRKSIPKIIFKDEKFRKYSYDEMPYDGHQIRKLFKGQTYITFNVLQTLNKDGSVSLNLINNDKINNALVKVSKRDIRTEYPFLRIASKEDVYDRANNECKWFLREYEDILNGNTFSIEIIDNINGKSKEIPTFIGNEMVFHTDLADKVSEIFDLIESNGRLKCSLDELFKQEEFKQLFNHTNNSIEN